MHDDPLEWFRNPEHEHIIGIDHMLLASIREQIPELKNETLFVDCGVEGERSYTYHFRVYGVPDNFHGKVTALCLDELAAKTPYRFEIACVESFYTE